MVFTVIIPCSDGLHLTVAATNDSTKAAKHLERLKARQPFTVKAERQGTSKRTGKPLNSCTTSGTPRWAQGPDDATRWKNSQEHHVFHIEKAVRGKSYVCNPAAAYARPAIPTTATGNRRKPNATGAYQKMDEGGNDNECCIVS